MKHAFYLILCLCLFTTAVQAQSFWGKFGKSKPELSAEQKAEQAYIKLLKEHEKVVLEKGELRAFNTDSKYVVQLVFTPSSFVPTNYNREHAANCRAILLDNEGTLLLNWHCRQVLMHPQKLLHFTIKMPRLNPSQDVIVTNFPIKKMVFKRNYALCQVNLPASIRQSLPPVEEPVLVKKTGFIKASEPQVVKMPLKCLFDASLKAEVRERMFDKLPDFFYAKLHGFQKREQPQRN